MTMDYLNLFKMPTTKKITGKSSIITNAFVNAIIPKINPTSEQVKKALDILDMNESGIQCCSYCGDPHTEWDHLRPLVDDKRPTGYVSEIYNLAPACGKRNQSKGNKPWETWINSAAKQSPKSRNILDLHTRINNLKTYEKWHKLTKIDFEATVGKNIWQKYWDNCENIFNIMEEAQEVASEIKSTISRASQIK